MNSSTLISYLALVFGGIALLVALMDAEPSEGKGFIDDVAMQSLVELEDRVSELAEENRRLRDQFAMLDLRPEVEELRLPDFDQFAKQEDFDALRSELLKVVADRRPQGSRGKGSEEEFKVAVADVLKDVRQDEQMQKQRSRLETRPEQLDALIGKMESWNNLTPSQSGLMRSSLTSLYARDAEYLRRLDAGEDQDQLSQFRDQYRQDHLAEIANFLDPMQVRRYQGYQAKAGN
ncbi:MAG: hypothetical protein MK209_03245 [Planctomycetes bacterium]|nr:hypothetical protein [Planctomycetota bacterium]